MGAVVKLPVLGARARFAVTTAMVEGSFLDGSPALARRSVGTGQVLYAGLLPGLAYFQPALPLVPPDRGTRDDSQAHRVPTGFHPGAAALVALLAEGIERPVRCSEPLVESAVLQAPAGVVIPLVNWSGKPQKGLEVRTALRGPGDKATLASGRPVTGAERDGQRVYTLDLEVADALVLR